MTVLRKAATGNGPIAETFAVPVGDTYRVLSASIHLNAAPTTSENLTIDLDSVAGSNYDARLYSLDLGGGAVTDLVWQPDAPLYLVGGDGLDVTWANTNGRTWGLLLTVEVA